MGRLDVQRARSWIDAGLVGLGGLAAAAALGGAAAGGDGSLWALLLACSFLLGFLGCALLLWMGRSRALALAGALASLAGLAGVFWPRVLGAQAFLALTFFPALFCTYSGIMHAVAREGRLTALLRWPATASSAVFCIGLAAIYDGASAPAWVSVTTYGAAGLTFILALAVIPIRIMEKGRREAALETTGAIVTLNCPRCTEAQEIRAGRRRCRRCRLVIAVDVEEPRCAGCGFSLFTLTGDRCPECGRLIPPEDRWSAAA